MPIATGRKRARRLAWWEADGDYPALHKDALDDAFDLINYVTFFVQCARDGNISGDELLHAARDRELAEIVAKLRALGNLNGPGEELHKIADILEQRSNTL